MLMSKKYQFFMPENQLHRFFTGVTNTYQLFTYHNIDHKVSDKCDLVTEISDTFHSTISAHLSRRAMPPSSVGQHFQGSPQPHRQSNSNFGPRGAVGNMSSNRYVSDVDGLGTWYVCIGVVVPYIFQWSVPLA